VQNAVEAQFDLIAIAVDRDTITMSVERVAKFGACSKQAWCERGENTAPCGRI